MLDRAIDLKVTLVAATSTKLLASNPSRLYCLIVNDGVADAYLMLGTTAVENRGIRLNNGGGSFEINATNPWHGEIHAISEGTPAILITEY